MSAGRPASGNGRVTPVGSASDWVDFGHFLVEQREALGLRRRAAAKRAGVPESEWKALEQGRREEFGGVRVLPNPSADLLARVASALEVPVDELMHRIGPRPRPTVGAGDEIADDSTADAEATALARRIARLPVEDRRLIAALLDRLLHHR